MEKMNTTTIPWAGGTTTLVSATLLFYSDHISFKKIIDITIHIYNVTKTQSIERSNTKLPAKKVPVKPSDLQHIPEYQPLEAVLEHEAELPLLEFR